MNDFVPTIVNIESSSRSDIVLKMQSTEKQEKLYSVNFKNWLEMMFFWLTILRIHRFESEDSHVLKEGTYKNYFFSLEDLLIHLQREDNKLNENQQ